MTAVLVLAILALAVVAAIADDFTPHEGRFAKMGASSGVVLLLVTDVTAWNAYAVLILAALVASWVGDLSLSYEGRRPFVIGLVSFALAHVMYIAAFIARGGLSLILFTVVGLVMIGVGAAVLRWLRPHRPHELRWPLFGYVVIIGVMVAAAFATLGQDADIRIPIAAVAFTVSDILVARQRFVAPSRVNRFIGLPVYFAAQILFVLSAA